MNGYEQLYRYGGSHDGFINCVISHKRPWISQLFIHLHNRIHSLWSIGWVGQVEKKILSPWISTLFALFFSPLRSRDMSVDQIITFHFRIAWRVLRSGGFEHTSPIYISNARYRITWVTTTKLKQHFLYIDIRVHNSFSAVTFSLPRLFSALAEAICYRKALAGQNIRYFALSSIDPLYVRIQPILTDCEAENGTVLSQREGKNLIQIVHLEPQCHNNAVMKLQSVKNSCNVFMNSVKGPSDYDSTMILS